MHVASAAIDTVDPTPYFAKYGGNVWAAQLAAPAPGITEEAT